MSKAVNNQQLDSDILQCRADILRAHNTMPLHNHVVTKNSEPQNKTIEKTKEEIPVNEAPPPPKQAVSRKKETVISKEMPEIPSFDLAQEIMAEQRKITAIRRKAPGQKNNIQSLKPKVQPANSITEQTSQSLSEQDKVIADIVARDIERLCRG